MTVVQDYYNLDINKWCEVVHQWARGRGWWEDPNRNFGELMMLIVTEAAEAFEEYRDGHEPDEIYYVKDKYDIQKPEGIPIELADIIIRIVDLCGRYHINIDQALAVKQHYNDQRPYRHGGKRA